MTAAASCGVLLSGGPLVCVLEPGHPHGHVYATGSWVDDHHADKGHG